MIAGMSRFISKSMTHKMCHLNNMSFLQGKGRMISEKTVELNITTELVNFYYSRSKNRPFILAPSQRQEATMGYDVEIGLSPAKSAFIQYKRAEPKNGGNILVFHLNRTRNKDQHVILKTLEKKGVLVVYALPLFYKQSFVCNNKQALLLHTKFLSPSSINPKGGDTGFHELQYDIPTNKWAVYSEEGQEISNNNIHDVKTFLDKIENNDVQPVQIKDKLKMILQNCNCIEDDEFYRGNSIFCIPKT
jgi:hypothetical protein